MAAKKTKTASPKCFRFDEITREQLAKLAHVMRADLGGARAKEAAVVRLLIAKEFKRRELT